MIARVWKGWTTAENADACHRVVSTQVLPRIAGSTATAARTCSVARSAHYDLLLEPRDTS